ncbi:hypothetical protein GUITHDRAFT_105969 [Guillardia theta CCMP2712]|uniref:Uncharacterized protein n=1 Tax=Guillardia theta (strain CCMP2712) TaxID=905079 RepID=L1JIQ2_GUITC|nr:hypothetical protein GUITHDRAFT_105969 [Guillardia theta CCMP2712]EKX48361.1 hypothetical protein GUITHDRAFT_105969 [Guillardia theta CCMP2712]|eukprot:XP_005835341.1 hypothetical protein GUITHDRAFT_105969 [Guillardia theta CCMP2712]
MYGCRSVPNVSAMLYENQTNYMYTLTFTLSSPYNPSPATVQVKLNPRVQSLKFQSSGAVCTCVTQCASPVNLIALEYFTFSFQIQASDCSGKSPLTQMQSSVGVAIQSSPDPNSQLFGTTQVAFVDGTATFDQLYVDKKGDGYLLEFNYLGNSKAFSIKSPALCIQEGVTSIKLLSTPEKVNQTAGIPFTIQPKVQLMTSTSVAYGSRGFVTASINFDPGAKSVQNPGTSQLLGTTILQSNLGTVTFTDLAINKASVGQGYINSGFTLTFAYFSATVQTGSIPVYPNIWTKLLVPYNKQPVGGRSTNKS